MPPWAMVRTMPLWIIWLTLLRSGQAAACELWKERTHLVRQGVYRVIIGTSAFSDEGPNFAFLNALPHRNWP